MSSPSREIPAGDMPRYSLTTIFFIINIRFPELFDWKNKTLIILNLIIVLPLTVVYIPAKLMLLKKLIPCCGITLMFNIKPNNSNSKY